MSGCCRVPYISLMSLSVSSKDIWQQHNCAQQRSSFVASELTNTKSLMYRLKKSDNKNEEEEEEEDQYSSDNVDVDDQEYQEQVRGDAEKEHPQEGLMSHKWDVRESIHQHMIWAFKWFRHVSEGPVQGGERRKWMSLRSPQEDLQTHVWITWRFRSCESLPYRGVLFMWHRPSWGWFEVFQLQYLRWSVDDKILRIVFESD